MKVGTTYRLCCDMLRVGQNASIYSTLRKELGSGTPTSPKVLFGPNDAI